jgi:hypothetical protein
VDVDSEFKEVKQLMEDDADTEIDELKVTNPIGVAGLPPASLAPRMLVCLDCR